MEIFRKKILNIGTFKTPHSLHFQNAVHTMTKGSRKNNLFNLLKIGLIAPL